MPVAEKQFALFCNLDGRITKVLHDFSHSLPDSIVDSLLFSIVIPSDLDKIINFFLELKSVNTAIGWELNIKTPVGAETFTLFGGVFENQIGIAASTSRDGAQLLFDDLTRINNEQVNLIRSMAKEYKELKVLNPDPPVNYYEELSRLNNDLVNTQRELSKKNRELDELNKLKNRFLGIAAHDLRNPLGNIYNYVELIEDEPEKLSENQKKFTAKIKTLSQFMVNLVDELLDFSTIESGHITLNYKNISIIGLVSGAIELSSLAADKKSIRIHCSYPSQEIQVNADPEKIIQVIVNFITNAIKYSDPDTNIEVKINSNIDEVFISVHDEGPGIQEQELEELFKPFQKTSNRSTAGEKSTGLGLFVCKRIIEAHNGTIGVQSKVGFGSQFYFSLPKANMQKHG